MTLTPQTTPASDPDTIALWRALLPLRSVISFMNSGAHPDDETSGLLAALGQRDGFDLSFVCSTRGEGGQNDIGQESGPALGTLRTAEMEVAAKRMNMALHWLSESPEDPIHDFGFSKTGTETLHHWGEARTLQRFVQVIREVRPDILCPTFLDVPGQHGHHRAMTAAAHKVMDLAADPAFKTGDLTPWQIAKLYLPAWSGAGQSYDDALPPPPATLTVSGDGADPVSGQSYAAIGRHSHSAHRSQGMDQRPPAEPRDYPLHLVQSHVDGPDLTPASGLPQTLADLGHDQAQDHIDQAFAAFPDRAAILHHASAAFGALPDEETAPHAHRITRKRQQLATLIRIAAGVTVTSETPRDLLAPDDTTALTISQQAGLADQVTVTPLLPEGWSLSGETLTLSRASQSDPYPTRYLPDHASEPAFSLTIRSHGVTSTTHVPLTTTPLVRPGCTTRLDPTHDVLNLSHSRTSASLNPSDITPEGASVGLGLPPGWRAGRQTDGLTITPPPSPPEGLTEIPVTLGGKAAQTLHQIRHDHTAPRLLTTPATLRLRVLDVALPQTRLGYIGGGNDQVDHWLRRIGMTVTDLSPQDLDDPAKLAEIDSIVIGIFALRFRDGLLSRMPALHQWVRDGGTLVTLYHRPWDNWTPETVPPAFLEIGQPSLRWRVTDAKARVKHLLPDHPLLNTPNRIGSEDWRGWHKERGLYFASRWDEAYQPLLSMADPDEAPLKGALLSANIGAGRHVHTSLILHHQMRHLVPGAFRLMANLVAHRN